MAIAKHSKVKTLTVAQYLAAKEREANASANDAMSFSVNTNKFTFDFDKLVALVASAPHRPHTHVVKEGYEIINVDDLN